MEHQNAPIMNHNFPRVIISLGRVVHYYTCLDQREQCIITHVWISESSALCIITHVWISKSSALCIITHVWMSESSALCIITHVWISKEAGANLWYGFMQLSMPAKWFDISRLFRKTLASKVCRGFSHNFCVF